MSQKEVVNTLLVQAKIEPGFTEFGNFQELMYSHIYFCCDIISKIGIHDK